jgi:outer membrane protein OmpA-like peptidoglycan-associated protein
MLGGVKLADYADNRSFLGSSGSKSDYYNIFQMAQDMYRELLIIKHTSNPEESVDRRFIEKLSGSFSMASTEAPIEYKEPSKGSVPLATQHRSIYFEPNSAHMSLDSRAVVDELAGTMRAYENTVVDIEGNTDSTGSRPYNIQLSHARADEVKNYLVEKYGFPGTRLHTAGNGPDKPIDSNATPEGREKNRRTDIKVYANPS